MKTALVALLALTACGKSTEDTAPIDSPTLEIVSPMEGDVFTFGDEVTLSADGSYSVSGDPLDLTALAWSAGDYSGVGNDLVVTDFPVGEVDLVATLDVDGREISASVMFTVEAPPAEPFNLAGPFNSEVSLYVAEYDMSFDDSCNGNVQITVETDWTMTGMANCSAFGESAVFGVTGAIDGEDVSGELTVEDAEETLPFTGTWNEEAGQMSVAFDSTFASDEGELTVAGTFNASVIE